MARLGLAEFSRFSLVQISSLVTSERSDPLVQ